MKNYKKLKKYFIGMLVVGVMLIIESVVMKLVMRGVTGAVFTYPLYGGIAMAAIGLIGVVFVSVKEKEKTKPDAGKLSTEERTISADGEAGEFAPENAQRVKTEISLSDEDDWRIKITVTYAVVLLVGLVGYFTAFGLKEGDGVTVCKAICLAYALITPSYFVYFGFGNPFRLSKAVSVTLAVFGIVAMAVCLVHSLFPYKRD